MEGNILPIDDMAIKYTYNDLVIVLFKQTQYSIVCNKDTGYAVLYLNSTKTNLGLIKTRTCNQFAEFLINLLRTIDADPIMVASKAVFVADLMEDMSIYTNGFNSLYRTITRVCDSMAEKTQRGIEPYMYINISGVYEQSMRAVTYASNMNDNGIYLYKTYLE